MMKDLNILQVLTDATQTIADCGKNLQKNAETIIESCHTPDTKGAAYKSLLLAKADVLKKLAALHSSMANRLRGAVSKLSNGVSEDKVLADVIIYSISFADQLKSEEYETHHILRILKKDGSDNSGHSLSPN